MPRNDPLRNFRFRLEIDGIQAAAFSDVAIAEVAISLPKGYIDEHGVLHRRGVMRLATAADEILPLRDPRVQQNQAYLAVIVLARVITKLGDVQNIDTKVVEGLFASDLDYLQR